MKEIKFAQECGFEMDVKMLSDETIRVSWNKGACVEIISADEAKELGLLKEESFQEEGLTEKENKVLKSVIDNTYEWGLPVETSIIKEETGLSKRSIAGVVSGLYKKGYLEEYPIDPDIEEFMLSEWAFERYCK